MYFDGLCFITGSACGDLPLHEMINNVLEAGVSWIQYREKNLSRLQVYENALILRKLTRPFGAALIINDYADIALAVEAEGVHLGQDDLPLKEARKIMGNRIVGISTHDLAQAKEAESEGADYIGYGPVFNTITKEAGAPRGVDNIRKIKENVNVPLVAIGGINPDNVASVMRAGADAVAVASAISKGDAAVNAGKFLRFFRTLQR